ncbi:MAG: sigma-70 family RNA polymerase sigma factor [Saprospiraceae bacterium]|nr:sigma-70 family RNA polymerase sigma factor [Saprospiraceae bacterium]
MKTEQKHVSQLVDHLFRYESGKMVAVLTKFFGLQQVELAEDMVQETLLTAFETWKLKGIPDNPQAWLYQVAKNRMLTYLKRTQNFQNKIAFNLAYSIEQEQLIQNEINDFFLDNEIEDAQLRMMFACCHPSVPPDLQLILILKTLCGLSIKEIAAALLSQEDTIAKRLYRAKEKIKQEGIVLEVPIGNELAERLDAVLKAIYLLFNEAYKSTSTETIIRQELSDEALRLGALLAGRPLSIDGYNMPKINALMALMCFHAARFDSRLDETGNIILLENQDRSHWNAYLTAKAFAFFKASASGTDISEYHVEAAIASYHAQAQSFDKTNWQAIFYCYNLLFTLKPTPIVAFNRAIARGYTEGAKTGIEALLDIVGLDKNHFYHTALGDFYRMDNQKEKAKIAYDLALKFVHLPAEKKVIYDKLKVLA